MSVHRRIYTIIAIRKGGCRGVEVDAYSTMRPKKVMTKAPSHRLFVLTIQTTTGESAGEHAIANRK